MADETAQITDGAGGGESGGAAGGGGGTLDKVKAAAGAGKKAQEAVGKMFSPEGVLMFSLAAMFDVVGLLGFIPLVGWIIEMVSDIVATLVFTGWMMGTGRKGWLKLILAAVIEIVPYLDDISPFVSLIGMFFGAKIPTSWIGFVYSVI